MKRALDERDTFANLLPTAPVMDDLQPPAVKKPNSEQACTKVLFVRNIPESFAPQDIVDTISEFGIVKEHLFMREKSFMFVEFEDQFQAQACLDNYRNNPMGQISFNPSDRQFIQKNSHRAEASLKTPTQQSRVLSLRNIPPGATESNIENLCAPFGFVSNILLVPEKNQGFVEFLDPSAAENCLKYYQTQQRSNKGQKQMEFHYTDRSSFGVYPMQRPSSRWPEQSPYPPQRQVLPGVQRPPPTDLKNIQMTGMSNICYVRVSDLVYEVNAKVLADVFEKYGKVYNVEILPSSVSVGMPFTVEAYVTMDTATNAFEAERKLDGQNIYASCNHLRVHVVTPPSNKDGLMETPGVDQRLPSLPQQPYEPPIDAYVNRKYSMDSFLPYDSLTGAPVCIVANLNEQLSTCTDLAALFSVYANVVRVKILYTKRSEALVQVADIYQASVCKQYLHNCPLHGLNMRVNLSDGGVIARPPIEQRNDPESLTREYQHDPVYNRHGANRTGKKYFAPSPVLHFSSMPASVDHTALTMLLQLNGCSPARDIRFVDNDSRHQAIVQFDSIEIAVQTLIKLHRLEIESRPIRVGFGNSRFASQQPRSVPEELHNDASI